MTTPAPPDALLPIAVDMNVSLSAVDRAQRLAEVAHRALRCDATALLQVRGNALVPRAQIGLSPDLLGRRFALADHPRLARIAAAAEPVVFDGDCPLPDPYDGVICSAGPRSREHAGLGCALRVDDELVGVLTADARHGRSFADVDHRLLGSLATLAGATLRTIERLDALDERSARADRIACELTHQALAERGGPLLGDGPAMRQLHTEIGTFADTDLPVLVTGETGTGKEAVVRTVHARSARADRALIHVDCAALPASDAERELFGQVGTGAARLGMFALADGASLFLDEVGELPPRSQTGLLRVLQHGELQRVGGDRPEPVDIRVLAATNRDLASAVRTGRFRADLLRHLDVGHLHVPALRDRAENVPMLAEHFAGAARRRLGCGPVRFTEEALQTLGAADWPGNIRELENVVWRAVLRAARRTADEAAVVIAAADLDLNPPRTATLPTHRNAMAPATPGRPTLRDSVDDHQRARIREAVARHDGNWAAAARELGLARSNLHRLARRLGLK